MTEQLGDVSFKFAVTDLTEFMEQAAESISNLGEVARDLQSTLIDYNYRQHIDGHLTYRIGDVGPKY